MVRFFFQFVRWQVSAFRAFKNGTLKVWDKLNELWDIINRHLDNNEPQERRRRRRR